MHGLAFLAVKSQHRWLKSVLTTDRCCIYACMCVRMCNFSPSHPVTGLTRPDHAWDFIRFPSEEPEDPLSHKCYEIHLKPCWLFVSWHTWSRAPRTISPQEDWQLQSAPLVQPCKGSFIQMPSAQDFLFFIFDNSDSLDGSFLPRSVLQKVFLKRIMQSRRLGLRTNFLQAPPWQSMEG